MLFRQINLISIKLTSFKSGAGNESRTRDLNLGKVALYQLSYSRVILQVKQWSGKRVSNSRPQPWQGCALPTELFPQIFAFAAKKSAL